MSKQKQHPLEVEFVKDSGCYSKGHHPLEDFAKSASRDWHEPIEPNKCRHVLMRYNPIAPNQDGWGEYSHWIVTVCKAGRGVFPATVYEIW